MRFLLLCCGMLLLSGCTWETYQDDQGTTKIRQKYEAGTRVFYEDGTYAHDQRYNKLRPVPHAIKPSVNQTQEVPANTQWKEK